MMKRIARIAWASLTLLAFACLQPVVCEAGSSKSTSPSLLQKVTNGTKSVLSKAGQTLGLSKKTTTKTTKTKSQWPTRTWPNGTPASK